jgi:prevent-host-death family protein
MFLAKEVAMRHVWATDAKQAFSAVLDAAQREPVVIRRQRRDVAVVLSVREYEKLTALNIDEFQRFCDRIGKRAAASGMTEDRLAEILSDAS